SILGDAKGTYQGFAEVTSLVQSAGPGTYGVANVQADTGFNRHAGWALVVVFGDPANVARNLTVFDGFAQVTSSDPNVSVQVSGFTTPLSGPVNLSLGVVAYEGDLGLTGDSLRVDGTTLADARHNGGNFFNSTISRLGGLPTGSSPNFANQLGFDASIIDASGIVPNGASSLTIDLTTAGDAYFPGV